MHLDADLSEDQRYLDQKLELVPNFDQLDGKGSQGTAFSNHKAVGLERISNKLSSPNCC